MKIVALHTDFRIYWPARLQALSSVLRSANHHFSVVEIAGKGSPYAFAENNETDSLHWICLFPESRIEDLEPAKAKQAVLKKLDEINPDAILSGAFAFTSGAAAIDWAKANNKAVVVFDDTKKEQVKRSFITNLIKRIFYSYVDAIFCPSEDWLKTYTYWGIPKNAVFYGMDVVDNQFWNNQNITNHSIPLPDKFLLCVGRQIECKNFSVVIDAYKKLHSPTFEYHLVFVGDGPLRETLMRSTDSFVKNKIHFLPFQSQESLREIYHRASFFILPSFSETWGLVVNEAMASGLPVIVSKQCGCANTLVKNGINGFTFDAFSPPELLSIFQKLDELEPQSLQSMKEESLRIINHWDLDTFSSGALNAISYAVFNKRKRFYSMGKFLLNKWAGRYNPI